MNPNRPLNLLSNYVGTGWTVLLQLLLVPVYIRLLGAESYGLVGFAITLQAVLQILDAGISPALNRELARRTTFGVPSAGTGNLVRTLEWIYWSIGLGLGLAIAAGSSLLAHRWVSSKSLSPAEVARAISLMGLSFALQWPISFYTSGLLGLQRQTLAALSNVATATAFGVGVVALLVPFPNVHVFFLWRAIISLATALALRRLLWSSLAATTDPIPPRFRLDSLQGIWGFSLGMTILALTGMILTQVDKVVLTRLLPLDQFGYYMLANTASSLLPQLVAPLFVAVFPMLSQAIVARDDTALREQFHLSAQLLTLIVCPAAVTLTLFSHDVLALWTGNEALARSFASVLSLLSLGALLNSFMVIPYALQIAHGWTRLGASINVSLVIIAVPYSMLAASRWGAVGAASTLVVTNGLYIGIGAPLTFRRLLGGQGLKWLFEDTALPLLCIAGTAAACLLIPSGGTRPFLLFKLALVGSAAYLAALLTTHVARRRVLQWLAGRFDPARPRGEKSA